jgi:hypothetical protein
MNPLPKVVLSQLVIRAILRQHIKLPKNHNYAFLVRTILVSYGSNLSYLFIYCFKIASLKVRGDFGVLVFFLFVRLFGCLWLL